MHRPLGIHDPHSAARLCRIPVFLSHLWRWGSV